MKSISSRHLPSLKRVAANTFSDLKHVWDRENEKWYFAIFDVIAVLTDNTDFLRARKYWNKLKQRLKEEGNETVTNCHQLSLRDNMTNVELILNMLAEVSATEISKNENPENLLKNLPFVL